MKWFFALNDLSASFDDYAAMLKAAVYSAACNAPALEPHFLYDGQPNTLTAWMEARQIPVIRHRVSLYPDLEVLVRQTGGPHFLSIGSGAFLRVDLPEIMNIQGWDDEYVLYTDADVLFLSEPDFAALTCRYFAVGPELTPDDNINMNTGVMLMNIPNLRRHQREFLAFSRRHLKLLCDLDWDQTAYRAYFHLEWQNLPPQMNWKPYWDKDASASILHFHGLKPTHEEKARAGALDGRLKQLLDQAGGRYFEYAALWRACAEAAERPFNIPCTSPDKRPPDKRPSDKCPPEKYPPEYAGSLPPDDIHRDQVRTRAAFASQYGDIVAAYEIEDPSWRLIKGELILWLLGKGNDSEAYLAVSRFLFTVEEYDAAFVHARLAYQFAPHSEQTILWFATILETQGNLPGARRVLEIGAALAKATTKNDTHYFTHLGRICLKMGDQAAAMQYYETAVAIDPADETARRGIGNVMRLRSSPGE